MKTIAVVGGGIAGLSAADAIEREAKARGQSVRVVVLEAEDRAGGKIGTIHDGAFAIETGPHGFLDKEPAVTRLIERLGLESRLIEADHAASKRWVVRKGALRELPMSPPKMMTSDVLPLFGRLRLLLEPLIARRAEAAEEESVWSFAARRLGRSAADVLVDAMVTGIFGGDPKRLSVSAAFPLLVKLERAHGSLIRGQIAQKKLGPGPGSMKLRSFDRGLGVLVDALAAKLEVRTRARVDRLERVEPRSEGGPQWRLTPAEGPFIDADAVVLTAPADATSRLVAPLHAQAAEALAAIPYAPIAVVVHAFEAALLPRALEGFGFLAPDGEKREVLGSIFASTVFRGHAPKGTVMLRTMLGGARHPDLAEGDDATLASRARRELEALVGLPSGARAVMERIVRWPRAIPQYELGHAGRVDAVSQAEKALPGLLFGGNALRGVAVVQCVADAEPIGVRALDLVSS